jgi:hypothetical protein
MVQRIKAASQSLGIPTIGQGIHSCNALDPEHSVETNVNDRHDTKYESGIKRCDVLPKMFGIVILEGRRGFWRIINAIFERTGIIVTDEFARIVLNHCVEGAKRSGKLNPGMERVRKIDDIARLFGTGDGLPQTGKAKDRNPKLRSMMSSLIASCQGRDVSHQAVVWRRIIADE